MASVTARSITLEKKVEGVKHPRASWKAHMIDIHTDQSVMSDGSLRYYKSPCTEQLVHGKVQVVVEDLMHRRKILIKSMF